MRRGKYPLFIFNKYINKKILNKKYQDKLIKNSVELFQSYNCKNLRYAPSLKLLIKNLAKNKILFLVTNGNMERQKEKLNF